MYTSSSILYAYSKHMHQVKYIYSYSLFSFFSPSPQGQGIFLHRFILLSLWGQNSWLKTVNKMPFIKIMGQTCLLTVARLDTALKINANHVWLFVQFQTTRVAPLGCVWFEWVEKK